MGLFRRKKSKHYEYHFMKPSGSGSWPNPIETNHPARKEYGAFGNLGSQGWRYIGMVDGMYAFEKETYW